MNKYLLLFFLTLIIYSCNTKQENKASDKANSQDALAPLQVAEMANVPDHPDSLADYADRMIQLAHKAGDTDREAEGELHRGVSFLMSAQFDQADSCLLRALDILGANGDDLVRAKIWGSQGDLSGERGLMESAMDHYKKALVISEARKDLKLTARFYGKMAMVKGQQGDISGSVVLFTRALQLAEQVNDSFDIGLNLVNIGVSYDRLGQTPEARGYYERALDVYQRIGETRLIAPVLMSIGQTFSDEDPVKAQVYYDRAIAVTMESGDLLTRAQCYGLKGNLIQGAGLLDSALYYHRKAYELAVQGQDLRYRIIAQADIGLILFEQGRHAEGIRMVEEACEQAKTAGDFQQQVIMLESLYPLYKEDGQPEKALATYTQYITLRDSLTSEENQRETIRQAFKYDYDKQALADSLNFAAETAIQQKEVQKQKLMRNGFMGGFALVALFAGVFFFQRNRISKEKARSEELLLNILPEEVAEELKAKGSAEAVHIDQVTVLFTDFKGFTAMSETLSPRELVRDLNECFSAFDRITEKYGIEKIKTIGDAYMAAGGLPTPNTTHATDVIQAALEMRDFIAEGKARKVAAGLPYFEIRIGVHTGPVVAGIVGVKKFKYDIWGDTVNTASRMESSGEVGQVNISEATYALVKGQPEFAFTPRGKVQAKGKGEMEMYFVEKRQ